MKKKREVKPQAVSEEVPSGVKDLEAFREYVKLSKHPILNNDKLYITSDDREVNLGQLPHHLQEKIKGLPQKEQLEIMKLKALYYDINKKFLDFRRVAFGQNKTAGRGGYVNVGVYAERKEDIIEYFGRMFGVDEMVKIITTEWKIPVSREALYSFRKEHAGEIEKKIANFRISHTDLRLSVKRSRMEELIWMYHRQKERFVQGNSREDYKLMLTTLEAIRKESEGEKINISGKIDVNHEIEVSAHLRDEVFKTMNIKEIVLGRVAARMGVSSLKLLTSLNNSYYAKFSAVIDKPESGEYDISFPSTHNYDFDKIRHLNADNERIEEAQIVEEIKPEVKEKSNSIKEAIKAKLKAKKEKHLQKVGEINASVDFVGTNKRKDIKVKEISLREKYKRKPKKK